MPKLRKLQITEVSLCERGSNPAAMITLWKSATPKIETPRDQDRNFNATGRGPAHDALFVDYDNIKRQKGPAQGPAAFQQAWAGLSDDAKDAIRAEEEATERAREAAAAAETKQREREMNKQHEIIVKAARAISEGGENTINRSVWHAELRKYAAARLVEGEKIDAAVLRLVKSADPDALALFRASIGGVADEVPEPVLPAVKVNPANDQIRKLAAELMVADPELSKFDALLRVHRDHPGLAEKAKAA